MVKSVEPEVRVHSTLDEASQDAAEEVVRTLRDSVSKKGFFSLALSGGSTPQHMYCLLASRYSDKIPWDKVHLFWSDERYVPWNHPQSNFSMAWRELISKVPLPLQNVRPISVDYGSPEESARAYEQMLREFFRVSKSKRKLLLFDVILLGMGEDGHIASLFARSPVLREEKRLAAAVVAPASFRPRRRITLTLPAINTSKRVFFLVAGHKKRKAVREVLKQHKPAGISYPAGMVLPREKIIWFVDKKAFG